MILLPNLVFNTQRSVFTPSTGVTAVPVQQLTDQQGQVQLISALRQHEYVFLPEGALRALFILAVDMAVDLEFGDIVTNMRLIDGVTPWLTVGANEVFKVTFIRPSAPGLLMHKQCFTSRFTGGGIPS